MDRQLDHGSKNRLMPQHAELFPGDELFAKLARAVCAAGCLPRKELFEAWEMARRIRRRVRGRRVVDLCAGHGLLAHVLVLLDDTSASAIAHDMRPPKSAVALAQSLTSAWPRLTGRIEIVDGDAWPRIDAGDLVVSCHACGALTDRVLDVALAVNAAVAVLPCCHDKATCDDGGVSAWMPFDVAVDATRSARIRSAGYRVIAQEIPREVTPKNRLLIGIPA